MVLRDVLNRFARIASDRSEVVAAAMVFLVVVMMVIPVNAVILDVLIGLNISLALLLVVISILLSSPLAFSSFPAILLISTMFRLAITVSTTRLILLDGYTGHIVETFGEFVVGGNVAVGVIIFLIISIVNFIVVTKGSERVAEVAARFSLDGMPGKQMSIDSDLRAGLIDQNQAKEKRATLEKETQLFGAMDGALKFVKGDAIAGLVIVFVNLIGGLFVGVLQKDMTFADAAARYSLLSVGDGLVALIPSLLVSIAAGLVVTRVTKADSSKTSVASDIIVELINNPKALMFTCVFAIAFGLIPGMPSTVFFGMSAVFGLIWFFRRNTLAPATHVAGDGAPLPMQSFDQPVVDQFDVKSISPWSIIIHKKFSREERVRLENVCRSARNLVVKEYGLVLPALAFSQDVQGIDGDLALCLQEIPIYQFAYDPQYVFVRCPAKTLDDLGIPYELTSNDLTNTVLCKVAVAHKSALTSRELHCLSAEDVLLESLVVMIFKNTRSFLTLQETNKYVARYESSYADLAKELQRVIQTSKLQDVLSRLLSEMISVVNFELIATTVIEWSQKERDLVIVTEHVRIALKNQISFSYAHKGELYGYVVAEDIEDMVRSALRQTATGSYLAMDEGSKAELIAKLSQIIQYPNDEDVRPVLVCSPDCRRYLRRFIEEKLFWLPVLSHPEVSPYTKLKMMGEVSLE